VKTGPLPLRWLLTFFTPLMVALVLLAVALTPIANDLIVQWFQRDLQLRSQLIFNSMKPSLEGMLREGDTRLLTNLFDSISEDERVFSVGWCDESGRLQIAARTWPKNLNCPRSADAADGESIETNGTALYLATFSLGEADVRGRLVVLQDISFIQRRSAVAQFYLMAFLTAVSLVAAAVTLMMAHLTLRGWVRTVRGLLVNGEAKGSHTGTDSSPMIGEIRQLIRDLDVSGQTSSNIRVDWSPDVLRRVLASELTGSQVIVVSNREPYIHNRTPDGAIAVQRPASGMVTALEPVMRACGGTWIAHGSGTADRGAVDGRDRVAVPPAEPAYTLRRIWLSEEEQDGYYFGLANEGLWPLCHITFVRPVFRESDWLQYKIVNRKFAEAIVAEAKSPNPVILVQDYHFALLPRMIKERLPAATIITFWHIPWPNAEVFGICPWREEILNGLLGSSVIGFHTQLHCNNFIDAADRFIECHLDREEATVSIAGLKALIRPYPISIAWPPEPMATQAPIDECRARVFKSFGLHGQPLLLVGVERFDFTKGIPDRFRAVEILLEQHPNLLGRFVLLQVAAPTRTKLNAYEEIQKEAASVAARVNARYGTTNYQPIVLVAEHHEPEQVFELFRAADACIVSSLHDGMNLVAKEFVAARDDEQGVLILSSFAGASRELMEALIVNPFDARATGDAIYRAMTMSSEEQQRRMRLMREMVGENNIYYWAGRMLLDASRIRKRQQLETTIADAARAKRKNA